jgi:hypothetical protein
MSRLFVSWFELVGNRVGGGVGDRVGDGVGGGVWVGIGVETRISGVRPEAICGLEMLEKARRIIAVVDAMMTIAVKIITTVAFFILQPLDIIGYKRLIALPKEQSVPPEEQYLVLGL